ncbi:MAG TPA: bifunctional 4-hydroxy-2-oxoglutarate aldolase/2-dehydro-3-deoxy-phosphogluconate aldolase [Conexibacter sp.]|jgi:2-dehydro-3-deoxyphosphogluconate aldolase/(4S)-4-hydroxy-2-oxoglutarate aldolase
MTAAVLAQRIEREQLLAIVRADSATATLAALDGLAQAGVAPVEIALSSDHALDTLAQAVERHGDAMTIGAGTVRSLTSARDALAAGAQFLVSPGFDAAIAAFARERDLLHLPGVFTPTEVDAALAAQAPLLKLFPAGRLGPGYIRDLLGPFPQARFVATGGVGAGNAADFISAGAVAVAPGGALLQGGEQPTAAAVAARAAEIQLALSMSAKERRAN